MTNSATQSIWPCIEQLPSLAEGKVMHARHGRARHAFAYPIFFLRIPLAALSEKSQRRWGCLFGLNRRALFSVMSRDHGARDGSDLREWLQGQLTYKGMHFKLGEVVLQTFPRVFGYVFNPVSFWFCHDINGALRAVLCEVNNTFGESHNYLVFHADARPIVSGDCLRTEKVFHVSPFFPVAGEYRFRFLAQAKQVGVNIEYWQAGVLNLKAHIGGRVQALSARNLMSALCRFPLMTLAVMARIHFHAFHLWRKGARFHRKPTPPLESLT